MKFQADFIDKVRDANDIVSVIGDVVELSRSGSSLKGLCPFPGHAERTPSFFVSEPKQVYHCFGCRKSGNVFSFLMDYHGMDFVQSVEALANRAGIPIPKIEYKKEDQEKENEIKTFFKLNKYVASYFYKNLKAQKKDHPIWQYIKKRNLSEEVLEDFKIGFAPNSWSTLSEILKKAKAPLALCEKLGLIKKKQNQEHFDIFRNRLMFPIISVSENVLGFGGRSIDENEQPKYLNSPETPVFNKSKTLYGVHATAKYIRAEKEVILVEGYMDLISLYQFGIKNVVATLGTAFTHEHARAIKKLCNKVIVLFDSDEAGQIAAQRALPFFLEEAILSKCLVLTGAKDPDEYIRLHGAEKFKQALQLAPDHFSVVLTSMMRGFKGRATDKKEVLSQIQPFLDRVKDQQLRSLYLQETADRLNLDTNIITHASPVKRAQVIENTKKNESLINLSEIPKEEKLLVQYMLVEQEYLERVRDTEHLISSFISPITRELAQSIIEKYCQNPSDFDRLAASLLGTAQRQILKDLIALFVEDRPKDKDEERKLVSDCILQVSRRSLKIKAKEILSQIKTEPEVNVKKLQDYFELAKEQKGPQRR